jgi:regulator of protease activity HflC (stomatin/prohibitin superfamily)
MGTLIVASFTVVVALLAVPVSLGVLRMLGAYAIVEERSAHVYVLFGKVVAVLDQPGLYCLWKEIGMRALIVPLFGKRHVVDRRLDQTYLRSQPVNSEEGAPMGVGVWYEMWIDDPVAYLFKNADPRGSLRANVANATVRCLSNMPLATLLENRHGMSRAVRSEVSTHSQEWGYSVGSTYIRKVHFRDRNMIQQIEEKVVNRLRQVTSSIRQDGANQVSIITSTANREAAVEFAKAAALHPQIVGAALHRISRDAQVAAALFDVLEIQRLLEGPARLTLVPRGVPLMLESGAAAAPAPRPAHA